MEKKSTIDLLDLNGLRSGIEKTWNLDVTAVKIWDEIATQLESYTTTEGTTEGISEREKALEKAFIWTNISASSYDVDYGFLFWYVLNHLGVIAKKVLTDSAYNQFKAKVDKLPRIVRLNYVHLKRDNDVFGLRHVPERIDLFVKPKYLQYFHIHWLRLVNPKKPSQSKLYRILEKIINEPINIKYIEEAYTLSTKSVECAAFVEDGMTKLTIRFIETQPLIPRTRSPTMLITINMLLPADTMHVIVYSNVMLEPLRFLPEGQIDKDTLYLLNLYNCTCELCGAKVVINPNHDCTRLFSIQKFDASKGRNIRNSIITCTKCEPCPICW